MVVLTMVSGFGGDGNRHGLMVGFSSIFFFCFCFFVGIVVVICWDGWWCSSDLGPCCG